MADKTEVEAALSALQAATVLGGDGVGGFMALPDGYSVQSVEQFQGQPNRARANHIFRETAALDVYVNRFGTENSMAYSDPVKHLIRVVIDDHTPRGDPAFREHVASFQAEFGAEYAAWRGLHGKMMSQVEAGLFLEDRATDVIEPDAATIMDMVMTFDALKKVTFRQSTRLHDGQRQITYSEENEARGNVTLPERIVLRLPVFFGQEPERVTVRVRYRIDDGSLRFSFVIADRDILELNAFGRCEDACAMAFPAVPVLRSRL